MTDTDNTPTLDDATLAEWREHAERGDLSPSFPDEAARRIITLARWVERLRAELKPWRDLRRALTLEAMESTSRAEAAEAALAAERARVERVESLAWEWDEYPNDDPRRWAAARVLDALDAPEAGEDRG